LPSMMRIILAFLLVVVLPGAGAVQNMAFETASLKAQGWSLEGIRIALTDIEATNLRLLLTIDKLILPPPFDGLRVAKIRCDIFGWQNNELWCREGRAEAGFGRGRTVSGNISLHISEKQTSFALKDLRLAGGRVSAEGVARDDEWRLRVQAGGLDGGLAQRLLKIGLFDFKSGKINLNLEVSGHKTRLDDLNLAAETENLTLQTKEGQWASEGLTLAAKVSAQNREGVWQWRHHSRFTRGGVFIDPVYLEAGENPIQWEAEGVWNSANREAEIRSFRYRHEHTGEAAGSATIRLKDGISLEKADLAVSSRDLHRLSSVYFKPFVEETSWDGISMAGNLNAQLGLVRNSLIGCSVSFHNLDIADSKERIGVAGGFGAVNWSRDETFRQPSRLAWQRLQLGALPIGAAKLSFLTQVNTIRLLEKARLPFLGGAISIKRFFWLADQRQEPEVYFEGNLSNVSLEQLSEALNWTQLSGTVSGRIPGIEYRNRTLKLGGELMVKVFDGLVKVGGLSLSGLFSDLPRLAAEIEIDNLDMDRITRRFEFGGITGRISGIVKNLVMENWKPISFYAWLGTPDDDDSRHRISQKAVKNIASIGGGGATDLVSRSFLSLFETFGYDKLGLGCYLHQGVCQLMGLEPTESKEGYYIVKGGGLPRIDVIGYNARIDWNVLMERLKRITASDEVIIQ
jgi:hypothetical protein